MSLLDARLQMVLSLVPAGSVLLDIGTDHCRLPAEGLLSGRLSGAFAADLRPGPLAAARRQLAALGLEQKIPLYLSNGLQSIPQAVLEKVQVICIAGMGGELISMIMNDAPAINALWVLQPMSAVYELLDTLAEKGYEVRQGALARDGDKFYRAFAVSSSGVPYRPDYFGMLQNDPLYSPYLLKEEHRILAALHGLQSARSTDAGRILQAQALLGAIRKAKQ